MDGVQHGNMATEKHLLVPHGVKIQLKPLEMEHQHGRQLLDDSSFDGVNLKLSGSMRNFSLQSNGA